MATPTLVQSVSIPGTGSTQAAAVCSRVDIRCEPTLANNLLEIGISVSSAAGTITIEDNKGNTWTAGISVTTVNSQLTQMFYCPGSTAGVTRIKVKFGTPFSGTAFFKADFSEWYNVATSSPADTAGASAQTSGTSYATGNIITVVDGDLIIAHAFADGGGNVTSWTPGGSLTLLHADTVDTTYQSSSQYWVQTTHGTINPGVTLGAGTTGGMVGMAFKSASAGTAPDAGIRVLRTSWASLTTGTAGTTKTFQVPQEGNLLICEGLTFTGTAGGSKITGITDTAGNTWAKAGETTDSASNPSWRQLWYGKGGTPSTANVVTVTFSAALGQSELIFRDVVNAAASPYNSDYSGATNTQSSNGHLNILTFTPGATQSLVVGGVGIAIGAVLDSCDDQVLFDAPTYPQGDGGSNPLAEDNGAFHYYNQNTNAKVLAFTTTYDARSGVGAWVGNAASFSGSTPTAKSYAVPADTLPLTLTGIAGCDSFETVRVPQTVDRLKVEIWGSGGGSARVTTNTRGGGGGCGADYSRRNSAKVTPGSCYSVRLGGAGWNPSGTVFSGQSSIFVDDTPTTCEAKSGITAVNNSTTGSTTKTGSTTGDTTTTGGTGANGGSSTDGGGGGGSGGSTGNGGNGTNVTGGTAGSGSPAGAAGGNGKAAGSNGVGTAGTAPGSGGGGSYRQNATQAGAEGGKAQAIFTNASVGHFYPDAMRNHQAVLSM